MILCGIKRMKIECVLESGDNRRAEHKWVIEKNEKKWCKNERRSQSLSFSGMVWQA